MSFSILLRSTFYIAHNAVGKEYTVEIVGTEKGSKD